MKDIITEYHGVLVHPSELPSEMLRMANGVGLIEDDMWLEMLRARNNLTHDYDGELAVTYFEKITSTYDDLMEKFRDRAAMYYQEAE